jgi:hypothetical protein
MQGTSVMQMYVMCRSAAAATATELERTLSRLRAFEEQPQALEARWIHSYVLRQAGRFTLACVFEAETLQALQRHAEQTGLPAGEILPIVTTVRLRPFMPACAYLVRRRGAWSSAAALASTAATARRVGDDEMASVVSWLRSYIVREDDGALGTICIYQATSPAALREHAARVGMPADEIVPVIGRIVFRRDAGEPIACGAALPA